MPDDIFHHYDGIIDQDPYGENKGKERDSIERVAVDIEDRQGQIHRNGERHHSRAILYNTWNPLVFGRGCRWHSPAKARRRQRTDPGICR
jgi:hypothetical protein